MTRQEAYTIPYIVYGELTVESNYQNTGKGRESTKEMQVTRVIRALNPSLRTTQIIRVVVKALRESSEAEKELSEKKREEVRTEYQRHKRDDMAVIDWLFLSGVAVGLATIIMIMARLL